MDEFSNLDMKGKLKQYNALIASPQPRSSRALSSAGLIAHASKTSKAKNKGQTNNIFCLTEQPKVLIFVKLASQSVFTPVNISGVRGITGLMKRFESKFGGAIRHEVVAAVYQRNVKGLTFHLTDDMLELMAANQVFDVEVKTNEDGERVEVTLIEVEQ